MGKPHSYTAEAFNDLTSTQLSSSSFSIEPNQRHRHVTSHRIQQIKSLSTKIYTHTHTRMNIQRHTLKQTHKHARAHTHTCTYKHIHTNKHTHTHTRTHTHTCTYKHIHSNTHTQRRARAHTHTLHNSMTDINDVSRIKSRTSISLGLFLRRAIYKQKC